nr:GNAT family N-acetyltransferase [Deinococcus sp.]
MSWTTRLALPSELPEVAAVLQAAALALEKRGQTLWPQEALSAAALTAQYLDRQYPDGQRWLGELETRPVATMTLLVSDPHFWPDAQGEALYLHKLAVHPEFQGLGLSTRMLEAAVQEARRRGCGFLRLDTVQDRPRLRAVYEGFGFGNCGAKHVQGYEVALYELRV